MWISVRDGEHQGVADVGLQPGKPVPDDTGAAGPQQVHAAVARGSFTPEVAGAILRSNPAETAQIVQMLQQNFGNGFVQQAMTHAGAEPHGDDHAPSATPGPDKTAPTGGKGQNPALPTWDDKLAGTLWAKDSEGHDLPPTLADIAQGGVKDCFLFAAMAAIVHTHPDQIQHMIKDHRNGTYTVAFKGTGTIFSDKQDVNLEFDPKKHGTVTGTKALWPLIIEKAYGQESGGLDKIDNGGNSGEAVETLTNKC